MHRVAQGSGNPIEITALSPEDIGLFYLTGLAISDRLLIPSAQDESDFRAEIVSGDVTLLGAAVGNRLATLRACEGTGQIRLTYMGWEREVAIDVDAEAADPACP